MSGRQTAACAFAALSLVGTIGYFLLARGAWADDQLAPQDAPPESGEL